MRPDNQALIEDQDSKESDRELSFASLMKGLAEKKAPDDEGKGKPSPDEQSNQSKKDVERKKLDPDVYLVLATMNQLPLPLAANRPQLASAPELKAAPPPVPEANAVPAADALPSEKKTAPEEKPDDAKRSVSRAAVSEKPDVARRPASFSNLIRRPSFPARDRWATVSLQSAGTKLPETGGMAAAPLQNAMQDRERNYQHNQDGEQKLPQPMVEAARPEKNASVSSEQAKEPTAPKGLDAAPSAAAFVTQHSPQSELPSLPLTPATPVQSPLVPGMAAERFLELISPRLAEIRQMGQETIQMVLKPDPETQIIFHFRWHDGQLQAQAACERGDVRGLQSDWHHLQQALSRQGVKLETLTGADSSLHADVHSGHRNFQEDQRPPSLEEVRDDYSLAGSTTEPPRRQKNTAKTQGTAAWERWA